MTRGQYSYLLLRRMQIYVSCSKSQYRAYLYNFYGEIFNDPSVILDGESYAEFCDLLDYEMSYLHQNNLRTATDIYNNKDYTEQYILLEQCFESIGVKMKKIYAEDSDGTDDYDMVAIDFTLPSGEVKTLEYITSFRGSLEFNSKLRVTDEYLEQMVPFYLLENEEPLDLSEIGCHTAGHGTYWTYDADSKTVEVTGNGSLANFALWELLGVTDVSTIIIGAGVNKWDTCSLGKSGLIVVDLHGEADEVIVQDNCGNSSTYTWNSKANLIIYSDNLSIRSEDVVWASRNATIEWHTLSEWNG